MVVIIPPTCIEDRVQADFRTLRIIDNKGRAVIISLFPYCTKCRSYLVRDGRTESPLEAAQDFYRQNPDVGKPRDVVRAEYLF